MHTLFLLRGIPSDESQLGSHCWGNLTKWSSDPNHQVLDFHKTTTAFQKNQKLRKSCDHLNDLIIVMTISVLIGNTLFIYFCCHC